MSLKNKLIVIVVSILLCIMTSCSNKDHKTNANKSNNSASPTSSVSPTTSNLETLNTFFSSQDGSHALYTSWRFAKAYFSADIDEMKKYLLDHKIGSYKKENVFNNLEYFNLDWNFCNVKSNNKVYLTYSFELGNDSLSYLDVDLIKLDGEWKISSYEFEK